MEPLKTVMHHYLRHQREALLWKLDGLPERDQRRPLTSTGTNLLGLLKHAVYVEAGYLGDCFGRPWPEGSPLDVDGDEDNVDMYATAEESTEQVVALAHRVWAHTDETIDLLGLDATGEVPWWQPGHRTVTLGQVLVHLSLDLARHAGHADILREQLDGAVGMRADNGNLPPHDAQWWADYVARLQSIADASRGERG